MPELPEVETLRRSLEPHVLGRWILRADLRRPSVCRGPSRIASPSPPLPTGRVAWLRRHGKQLALGLEGGSGFIVHLGMSGQVLVHADPPPGLSHVHCTWSVGDSPRDAAPAVHILFRDPRRFGRLTPFADAEGLSVAWAGLGPDGLTISALVLRERLAGSRRCVKAALLDQRAIAGVGNIYADEALFAARIRPTRRAGSLSPAECSALARAIRTVLRGAIRAGGSTLRDYLDADARPGSYRTRHRVYGRAGLPCSRCGVGLSSRRLSQRMTVWCRACQH
jgi:formamidopyrimidine-DNA glycosylase